MSYKSTYPRTSFVRLHTSFAALLLGWAGWWSALFLPTYGAPLNHGNAVGTWFEVYLSAGMGLAFPLKLIGLAPDVPWESSLYF